MSDDAFRQAQLALFRRSVLKQAKWRALRGWLGDSTGLDALDLGADNGVISWLLRREGGTWTSADLTDQTVLAIRRMVGERVHRLTGPGLPFADGSFDLVVVVDLLEHLDDDAALLREIARCLRPGGRAILNVPHEPAHALLPAVRHALGLTDEWHGHRHAGYTRESLGAMLPRELRLKRVRGYSRTFSHLLDTALNAAFLRSAGSRAVSTAKGMVVTGDAVTGGGSGAMALAYPAMKAFAALDALLPFARGYMLLAEAEKGRPSTRS